MRSSTATRVRLTLFTALAGIGAVGASLVSGQQDGPGTEGKNDAGTEKPDFQDSVVVIPLEEEDLSDGRRFKQFKDLLEAAAGAEALVFDLNVTGSATLEIHQRLLEELPGIAPRTVSYVNPSALGPGAILALGTDEIYFSPVGVMGGSGLVVDSAGGEMSEEAFRRKYAQELSVLEARARSLATLKGHDPDLVKAFIDSEFEWEREGEVLSSKGEILTLTADEATRQFEGKSLVGAGVVDSIDELVKKEGLSGERIEISPSRFAEQRDRARRTEGRIAEESPESGAGAEAESGDGLFTRKDDGSYAGKVLVVKIGEADLMANARFEFMERAIKKAKLQKASALIIDMDTPGGVAWQTAELMMKSLAETPFPTYTFVNPNAVSAGSLIAVSTDHIYMYPASNIGSALVVSGGGMEISENMQQKVDQMMISTVRNVAELKGHNPDIAEAFVNKDKEVIIEGVTVSKAGTVLNLNANEATEILDGKPVLAKGIARSVDEIIARENLEGERFDVEPLGLESFAHWVQRFSFLLIILGLAGAYMELQAPGFGVPGVVSLLAFGLFFFGNYLAGNLAGYELAVLLVIGLLLIAVEIFILPGTMIAGITGTVLILASLALAMVDRVSFEYTWEGLPDAEGWGTVLGEAFTTMSLGLIGAVVLILVAMRFLPESKAGSWMILDRAVAGGASLPKKKGEDQEPRSLVGLQGVATTDLRPAGKGNFENRHLDITADGDFIKRGTPLRIIKHEGSRIVVVSAEP